MRHSNHTGGGRRLPAVAVGVAVLILAGCGASANGSVPPSAAPTPVVTPDPHLKEPVTADQIYTILAGAKLQVIANSANLGRGNPLIVKQINASIASWPMRITQYRSAADMTKALGWKPGQAPGGNEAPYAFAGLNVLIQVGPITQRPPATPDAMRQQSAAAVVAILDPLLWPLRQRSVVAIPSRTPEPTGTVAPPASAKPAKSTKPSKAP